MFASLSKRSLSTKAGHAVWMAGKNFARPSPSRFTCTRKQPFTTASESQSFSAYEYPTRTEAPEISSTRANDISSEQIEQATSPKLHLSSDPFDDRSELSPDQREQLKKRTTSSLESLALNSLPITEVVPSFVPSNVASVELEAPETCVTTLENGIRVVSQETYGQMSCLGVLTNCGSRHETSPGTLHLLETMAFGNTKNFTGLKITELLQDWGATRFVSHSREQTLHCIDILRPNARRSMGLLAEVVLEPKIGDSIDDFYHALDVMSFQAQEQLPQLVLGEALHVAAYGVDQQLGKPHFATLESIADLSPTLVENFYHQCLRNNPEGMVIAGAGISHDSLVDFSREFFGHIKQESSPITVPSIYRGGSHQIPKSEQPSIYSPTLPSEELCHVALAFPVGGWHDSDMVVACVLQMLLGGGSSFSAGGPGKGMYTRMYQQVLNRYGFFDSAEAFTSFADEGGLFGVSASTASKSKVSDLVPILGDQLARLEVQPVSDVELSRARNMLKCNVLTQLESRLILFEDMGRQLLTYRKREDAATTCAKIDAVTADDIQRLVQKMLKENPTLAATGSHLDKVPSHSDVAKWFR